MSAIKHDSSTLIIMHIAALLLVGCTSQSPSAFPTITASKAATEAEATSTPNPTSIPDELPMTETEQDLDLREANVLEAEFERRGENRYRFDVTLLHDDDGEAPSYADRWQVWDDEGNMLGERVLTHSHSTQPFTRSATIDIPESITVVLVRGHDMEHGYGGQSMRVNLESGDMQTYKEQGN
jgi:hypothetical protein